MAVRFFLRTSRFAGVKAKDVQTTSKIGDIKERAGDSALGSWTAG